MGNYTSRGNDLIEHVWYTLLQEDRIFRWSGNHLKYFIAGSFATYLHTGQYAFNDIDVFVVMFHPERVHEVDNNVCYKIDASFKTILRDRNGSLCLKFPQFKDLKVNIIMVYECSGLDHLIEFFDVNSCQVGYEMDIRDGSLGEVVFTDFYNHFLRTRTLEVVSFHTPAASLFRLMNKSLELDLPSKISANLLMQLKWCVESKKNLNKGLFKKVYNNLFAQMEHLKFHAVRKNFHFNIVGPSEAEKNADFYDHGEPEEYSSSMSFLIKNGCGVEVFFTGDKDNDLQFSCINGDNDSFVRFMKMVEVYGPYAAFEKDELGLTCLDYLMNNQSSSAIHANNFLITELIKIKY